MPSGHDPMGGNRFSEKIMLKQKGGNRFSEKIMLKQKDEIMIRFDLIGS